ncbi:MAG: biosynthetic peptidoglycan transglycosylase [Bacteroidota bacterium]
MNSDKSLLSTIQARIQTWTKRFRDAYHKEGRGKRIVKKTAWISGVTLTVLLVAWIALRGLLLNWAFDKAVAKLDRKGYNLQCESKGFTYLFGVEFQGLSLNHKKSVDTLPGKTVFACKQLAVGLNVWKFWDIGLSGFVTQDLVLDLVNLPNYCNYCDLLGTDEKSDNSATPQRDPVVSLFRQLEKWIGKAPNHLEMSGTRLSLTDTTGKIELALPNTLYRNEAIDLHVKATAEKLVTDKDRKEHKRRRKSETDTLPRVTKRTLEFLLQGDLDKDDLTGHVSITPANKQKYVSIPLVLNGLGFQRAEFEVSELGESFGAIHADLQGGFIGLQVDDERISDTLVQVDSAHGRFVCDVKDGSFELDSQSTVRINQIGANVFAQYQGGNNPKYALGLYMPRLGANAFFSSLPVGLFRNIGIPKATGTLEYRFKFAMEHEKPHDCVLESQMWPSKDFTIVQWGDVDPRIMNGAFTYTYWDKGEPVARFEVGGDNGNFTSLESISKDLVRCVLRSEDPDFFHHQGFYMDAFRSSIAQNYRQKRFARGGSTISMQLVKNVFLGRRKTIARKVEEILLTWLMERRALVSKNRMMEVYLNVIEWGPGIFGATEAAQFYFHKHPSELTLGECTFLASIIPMPKKVRWFLDSNGCVKSNNGHFRALKNRLLAKDSGSIDTAVFQVCVHPDAWNRLKGPAKKREDIENSDDEAEETEIPLEAIEDDNQIIDDRYLRKN